MRIFLVLLLVLSVMACGTISSVNPVTGDLKTQETLDVPPGTKITAETGVAAGALALASTVSVFGHTIPYANEVALLFIIYDPLAPNWRIEEQRLNEDTFHLYLRAKNFRTGGDGEAVQILKRRALKLQREKGYTAYRILDYSEGIESSTPLTHRVSQGTIQLVKNQLPAVR